LFLMKCCFLRQQIHPAQLLQSDDKKKVVDKAVVNTLSNAPAAIPLPTTPAVPSVTVKQAPVARIKVSSSVSKTRQNIQQQAANDPQQAATSPIVNQTVAENQLSFQQAWQLWL